MKKSIIITLCAVIAVGFVSCKCKNKTKPGESARNYVVQMHEGDYPGFLECLICPAVSEREEQKLKEKFAVVLREEVDPIVKSKGGVKNVKVVSEKLSEDGKQAAVAIQTTYNNGQTADHDFDMVLADDAWKIDMSKHRNVWHATTADGKTVTFKVKDYHHKDVLKTHIEGEDREFAKEKYREFDNGDKHVEKTKVDGDKEVMKIKNRDGEDTDRHIIKLKEDGEKEVIKVIEKEDEIIIKEKKDGKKEVERIEKD